MLRYGSNQAEWVHLVSTPPAQPEPMQYVGQYGYYTDATGFVYVRARYYDPANGTWISRDPIGFQGLSWNTQVYALNQPVQLIDPTGLQQQPVCVPRGPSAPCMHGPLPQAPIAPVKIRMPKQGPAAVYKCVVHNTECWESHWTLGCITFEHEFISTSKCGAFGYYGSGLLGHVQADNEYLMPYQDYGGVTTPGVGKNTRTTTVTCTLVSTDPDYEAAVCKCIQDAMDAFWNNNIYFPVLRGCVQWVSGILDCAKYGHTVIRVSYPFSIY